MRLLVFMVSAGLLAACGQPKAVIQGKVVDHRGLPLEGVEIRVLKSGFSASSSSVGDYSVPYGPGSFQVEYTKAGYTTTVVDHNIQVAMGFPSDTIELVPMPTEPGIYLLGEKGLEPLVRAKFEWSRGGMYGTGSARKAFCTGEEGPSIPAGRVRVVDTRKDQLVAAKLGGYGLVFQPNSSDQEGYSGFLEDEKALVGTQQMAVRTFEAAAGPHAFVPKPSVTDYGVSFGKADACWSFSVK